MLVFKADELLVLQDLVDVAIEYAEDAEEHAFFADLKQKLEQAALNFIEEPRVDTRTAEAFACDRCGLAWAVVAGEAAVEQPTCPGCWGFTYVRRLGDAFVVVVGAGE